MSSIKRHTAYNVAGAVIPLLAIFFTLPVYLQVIGEERYGVLVILWTLLGYFGLFDLGLGRAVTNRIAAFRDRTALEREEVFWTALFLNLLLGVAGTFVFFAAGKAVFLYFVDVPGQLTRELEAALPWIVGAFPLLLTSSVMSGALMGREEFLAQNGVKILSGVLTQVVPLTVSITFGPALPALVIAVLSVRAISAIALFVLCVRQLPIGLRPSPTVSNVRPLFGFGGWVTITSVVSPLLSTLDRVIIGAVAGIKAVTYYSVPFGVVSRLSILPGALSTALFPRFSAEIDRVARRDLMLRAVRTLASVLTPAVVVGTLLMFPFLSWWVDEAFALASTRVGELLLIGIWANCLAYIALSMLQGSGRPDLVAKAHLLEVGPYLLLLWFALKEWGAAGAAAIWSLRVIVDAVLLFTMCKIGWRLARELSVPAFLILTAASTVFVLPPTSSWRSIVGVCTVAASLIWSWSHAPDELKDHFTNLLKLAPARRRWLS